MARAAWAVVRYAVVVPLLQLAVYLCAAMSLMLFAERLYMGLVVAALWLRRRRRQRRSPSRNKGGDDDLESGAAEDLPLVLVQIPMFNEKQVYRLSIGAACGLWWPADKLVIQVLDDSTDAGVPGGGRVPTVGRQGGAHPVRNELPSSFKAYRYQQHRWSCGPANLMRKMFWEIVASRQVSAWKKVHVLYGFFFVRKVVAHLVTFLFYCVVIPAYVLVGGQDVRLPKYVAMYVPAIITLLNAVCTPRSWHLLVFWILFENVMSMHRSKATIIGLVEASRANEWVVTEKLGSVTSSTPAATTTMATNKGATKKKKSQSSILAPEIVMGLCLLYCAVYDIVFGHDHFYVYLLMQSAAAFVIGFGYVGSQ
uniref:Glycosyltransferase 2-like domain-containing protein n=1 Tax=Aegilops tauschii TaxID=37682 RepID=N1QQ58_AEGTA